MTIVITLAGVLLIVRDGIQAGSWLGDSLALATAVGMATALTLTRKSGKDLSMTPAIGGFISVLVALPVVGVRGLDDAHNWSPLSGHRRAHRHPPGRRTTRPRAKLHLSPPKWRCFFLLETVLTPVWVWFIFSEVPTANSLMGGAIVIVADSSAQPLATLGARPPPTTARVA